MDWLEDIYKKKSEKAKKETFPNIFNFSISDTPAFSLVTSLLESGANANPVFNFANVSTDYLDLNPTETWLKIPCFFSNVCELLCNIHVELLIALDQISLNHAFKKSARRHAYHSPAPWSDSPKPPALHHDSPPLPQSHLTPPRLPSADIVMMTSPKA